MAEDHVVTETTADAARTPEPVVAPAPNRRPSVPPR